jgi:hypothetical protein
VKYKVKGFRDVDPVNYQMVVGKFINTFEDDFKDDIWNSSFESVDKKLRPV